MARISDRYFDLNSNGVRSVEENWKFFHEQYLQLIEEHVPKKTLSINYKGPSTLDEHYFKMTILK